MDEKTTTKHIVEEQKETVIDENAMEQGFHQLDTIYRSRSVQSPRASNVTVREIKKDKDTLKN